MSTLRSQIAAMREAIRTMRQAVNSGVRRVPWVGGRPDPEAVEALGPGSFIIMPMATDAATWEAEAIRAQQDLARQAEKFFATGQVPGVAPSNE